MAALSLVESAFEFGFVHLGTPRNIAALCLLVQLGTGRFATA
jgi:hypothetical protein